MTEKRDRKLGKPKTAREALQARTAEAAQRRTHKKAERAQRKAVSEYPVITTVEEDLEADEEETASDDTSDAAPTKRSPGLWARIKSLFG